MFDEARLERLIDAYFDGQLAPGEKEELESMLLGSSRARKIYLERAEWHGLAREWALRENSILLMDDGNPAETPPKRIIPFPRKWAVAAGLAACAALAVVLSLRQETREPEVTADGRRPAVRDHVALLGQVVGVVWEEGSEPFTEGSALPKGWLKIREGTLRLDFYSGARVVLQGPAELELISQDLARLEKGRLTANVPPPAEGFTVLNSNLRVVDRGTEFGMSVNGADDCEVHVFDGEVELQGDVPEAAARALFEGDALSIREGRATAFTADRQSFTDPASLMEAARREAGIRLESWRRTSEAFRSTPGLLVYFDFEDLPPGSPIIPNQAADADPDSFGTMIGCDRPAGRWSGKSAIGFAKTSDRVRFRANGTTPSLTMMAWVRVDSLPLDHNALLSMAPDQIGEIHWKLDRSGKLLLGLRAEETFKFNSWERLESPPIVTEQSFGRWMHLATTVDGDARVMKHYVNGTEVASGPIHRPTPVRLGPANLGNFDAAIPARDEVGAVRNFNGRIDEFALLDRALDAEEIRTMVE